MPVERRHKTDSKKTAHLIAPPRYCIKNITDVLTDDFLETQLHLSDKEKWRISTGCISKRELDMLIPALVQGSYVDPQIAQHISIRHRAACDTYLSQIIRVFVRQLSFTQNIVADDDHLARCATGEWVPTLEDFRYDWKQPATSDLNKKAIWVITKGILDNVAAGNYVESLLGGKVTFPDLNKKVKDHFRYLSRKISKASGEADGGIEAEIVAKAKARRRNRRRAKFIRRVNITNAYKADWGDFLPFLNTVGPEYMSDEESDRDVEGVPYLTIRAPEFRPSLATDLFNALDALADKFDEYRIGLLRKKHGPKYERHRAEDGVPSEQPPLPFLPRDCYDTKWLEEDPAREKVLRPAPAMDLASLLKGLDSNY